ncbi:MAG TPA: M28 family peptidase [Anaerolineae bacterium]|nr:M28 family peptidase [Anaerolineae bacterium]
MGVPNLEEEAASFLAKLCTELPTRRTGTAGNRAATAFFADRVSRMGWRTECPQFDCMDWKERGADLIAGGRSWPAQVSPFSAGGTASGPLSVASAVEELEGQDLSDAIVLLRGEIAREQLMPKEFTFYNPEEHRRIVRALESARPQAIVAATGRNPDLAGALYPFPLIEDGDVHIPSVFMTDVEGDNLAQLSSHPVTLHIRAERWSSTGCNVIARRGGGSGSRAVLFAHIDAKEGSPGAIDNAGSIAVLLLLAELPQSYAGDLGIEIVAMNGEDYYAAPGEKLWLSQNRGLLQEICLGINLDGVGHRGGRTAYSRYGCPESLSWRIRSVLCGYPSMIEGQPWYQSDHSLFLAAGVPALAFTSEAFTELWSNVAHTELDRPELVDVAQLGTTARALRDLLLKLDP